jgi:hypothetical protein
MFTARLGGHIGLEGRAQRSAIGNPQSAPA